MGYPTEIFEVTDDIVDDWQLYEKIISHRFAFDDAPSALQTAATPGAADRQGGATRRGTLRTLSERVLAVSERGCCCTY